MPNWLDGRTIAVMTTTITAALALGTMVQTAHSSLRNDIQNVRTELSDDIQNVRTELSDNIQNVRADLSDDINKLDDRLRSVEVGIATIQTAMAGSETRLRVVERHADDQPAFDGSGG